MSSSFAKPFARPFARPLGLPLAACCLSLLLVPAAGVAPAVAEPAAEAVQGSADSTVAAQRDAALARLASGAESEESTLEDAASALLSQAILATRDPKGPEGRAFSSLWSRVLARVLSHPEPERAGWSRACLALCLPGTYAGESWKLPARLCPARMPALADSIAATLCAGADSVEARGRVILAFAREPEIDALSGFPHARAYWRQPPGGGIRTPARDRHVASAHLAHASAAILGSPDSGASARPVLRMFRPAWDALDPRTRDIFLSRWGKRGIVRLEEP